MKKQLRNNQILTLENIRKQISCGQKRIIVNAPVAFGKTILSAEIVRRALEKKNRAIFTVPQTILIDQTVNKFYEYGIKEIGVLQADHPLTNYLMPVQVASVQTLARRKIPESDIVIIDEAHLCFRSIYNWMESEKWQNIPFIGLSATPWARGMGQRWKSLIVAATMEGLTKEGYLSPIKYMAPFEPDLRGIPKIAGDYHEGRLSERMRGKKIRGKPIEEWLKNAEGRPTIAFCVDRAHASQLADDFNEIGVPCGYIDAKTPLDERNKIGRDLEAGRVKVVTSVGCLIVGLDWTFVSCILHCRPTKSTMLYIQSIGRGIRLHPGKKDCLILDVAGNFRLGHPYDIKITELDDGTPAARKRRLNIERETPEAVACKKCGLLRQPALRKCPSCGFEQKKQGMVEDGDETLFHVTRDGAPRKSGHKKDAQTEDKQTWYSSLLTIGENRGYKEGWPEAQFKTKFGVWPRDERLTKEKLDPPDPGVQSWVKSRMIRWAKSRKNK